MPFFSMDLLVCNGRDALATHGGWSEIFSFVLGMEVLSGNTSGGRMTSCSRRTGDKNITLDSSRENAKETIIDVFAWV